MTRAVSDGPPDLPGLEFERVLGSGGFSDVYLYRQLLPLRHVAVKVLKDSGLAEGLRSQLTAEANAMAGLADHPNIVPVFSAAVSNDGRPYIVMSYYSRPNLAVRAATERFGVAEVLRIGIQIASAVETAHRAGILHRDIKPANILTNQYGAPGLTDFGIAARIHGEEEDEIGVSVPWSAPEVLYGTESPSVRSDVYSLGATLWHLLVGRSPFQVRGGDNSEFELMRRIRDLPPPPTGRADVPDSLERLLRQAMAKDPRARMPSAIELARGLQSVEMELHLPRTDLVVISDRTEAHRPPLASASNEPAAYVDVSGPGAPATIARPASYSAQPAIAPAPPGAAPQAPETAGRPMSYAPDRPPTYTPDRPPTSTGEQPSARRVPGALVAGVAAVVVGAATVGGFVLFSGGSGGHPGPKGTVSNGVETQNAGNLGENVPPGPVKVVGRKSGRGTLVFTWTYSAALPGDSYQWQVSSGGTQRGVVSSATVTLPAPSPPRTVCVEVRVVRADGSDASPSYSRAGCVT